MQKVSGQAIHTSSHEDLALAKLSSLLQARTTVNTPQWNHDLITYLTRQSISRVLYLDELYQKILPVPGVILEFGVRYGSTMSTLINLRGIYEPFNHQRKVIGFDTFSGFPSVHSNDSEIFKVGDYGVTEGYQSILEEILLSQESLSPVSHLKKFELVPGDILQTVQIWLEENPGLQIAMAIFDLDIYEPTKHALNLIRNRLMKGSVVVFDEFSNSLYPGETLAVREIFDTEELKFGHSKFQPPCAWFTV